MRPLLPPLLFLLVAAVPAVALAQHHTMPYAGQQTRLIKALSEREVAGLLAGAGMGMAKAAELNHYPGPRHVLDLAAELGITPAQQERAEAIFHTMQERALALGRAIIERERELDGWFATRAITPERLEAATAAIAGLNGELRRAHLAAHLELTALLTPEQIGRYVELRGYGAPAAQGSHAHHGGQPSYR